MKKYWATKDEAFTWMPSTSDLASTRKTYPEHFAHIPEALFKRLTAAWAEVDKVATLVSRYAGKER